MMLFPQAVKYCGYKRAILYLASLITYEQQRLSSIDLCMVAMLQLEQSFTVKEILLLECTFQEAIKMSLSAYPKATP
jgi:hypothetical protein